MSSSTPTATTPTVTVRIPADMRQHFGGRSAIQAIIFPGAMPAIVWYGCRISVKQTGTTWHVQSYAG